MDILAAIKREERKLEKQLDKLQHQRDHYQSRPAPTAERLDSLIVGYYEGEKLMYVARTRNGFVPASRRRLFEKLRPLVTQECPFANLPETRRPRWGDALDAQKMKKCVWVRPELAAQTDFLEWTDADHLRHSKFVGLREDKDARAVVKEHADKA